VTPGARFREILRPYRGRLLVALLLNFVHGFAVAWQTMATKYVIDAASGETAGGTTDTATRFTAVLAVVGLYLAVSVVGKMTLWHLGFRVWSRIREELLRDLRSRLFRHATALCLRFHHRTPSGELHAVLFGHPVGAAVEFGGTLATGVSGALATLILSATWLAGWDLWCAATLAGGILVNVLLLPKTQQAVHRLTTEHQQVSERTGARVLDLLRGARSVKIHAAEDRVADAFTDQARELAERGYRLGLGHHLIHARQELIGYLGFSALAIVAGWRFIGGHITAGELAAFLTAFFTLQWPLGLVLSIGQQWAGTRAGLERLEQVLGERTTVPDPPAAQPAPERGELRLEGLRFAYDPARPPALDGVDLTIPAGQRIALVGASGAGKSTIGSLLLRLYDPDGGAITVGGTDLRALRGADWRARWGAVPQDPFVFAGSVRDNLALVAPAAGDAAMVRALEQAGAWAFVSAIGGLDARLGEGGATISGGQRQRLAIARAFLGNPAFYLFDEATSALDAENERLVQDAITALDRQATVVVIAHRLATVRACDRVVVLDQGRVVEDGPFADLARAGGPFQRMVALQDLRG
jgi:ATP-binding cassette subfamily B protein/subfamily B ATP-binding cassette protein MsbA